MKLSLIVFRCKNIEETKGFYERIGLSFDKEKHGNGPEHYSSENDGVVFELYPVRDGSPLDNTRLGFVVSDVEAKLSNFNVVDEYEFSGKKTYVVVDPDGRKIELT